MPRMNLLVPDREKNAVVFGIDPPVGTERQRRIGGPEGLVQKDLTETSASLPDDIEVAVLAVRVDVTYHVYRGSIDAPFESVVVGSVRAVILELPFDVHARIQLRDEIRTLRRDRTIGVVVAIRPGIVLIVLDTNRV